MSVVCEYSDPSEMITDEEMCNVAVFQISYTTVFGAYSAFLFLRTGETCVAVSPVTKPLPLFLCVGIPVMICIVIIIKTMVHSYSTYLAAQCAFQCSLDEGEKIWLI